VVIPDRAYTALPFPKFAGQLLSAGIEMAFELTKYQRENSPVHQQVIWRDGTPLHAHTPPELLDLERPTPGTPWNERRPYQEKFNQRARWRWSILEGRDEDGYVRLICPFDSGRLKNRNIRQRKVNKTAPLVELPEGVTTCCDGRIKVDPIYVRLMQTGGIPYGTTAHDVVFGRRNHVETGNSYLGGTFISLDRTYARAMGRRNRLFLLGFMIAGLNRYIAKRWRERLSEIERRATTRAKRRKNTLAEITAPFATTAAPQGLALDRTPADAPMRN
jgi:hypothetical protein